MKETFPLSLLALLLLSPSALTGCAPAEWYPASPQPGPDIGVYVTKAIDVDLDEHAKVEQAIVLLDAVLRNPAFWTTLEEGPPLRDVQLAVAKVGDGVNDGSTALSAGQTYAWNKVLVGDSVETFSNKGIVALLRRAHEPGGERDGIVEFGIRRNLRPLAPWCGWPWYGEIGHRELPNVVMTQDCKMARMSAAALAGHWLHEYMHMLGFDHAPNDDALRPFSVPYFVGNAAEALAASTGRAR